MSLPFRFQDEGGPGALRRLRARRSRVGEKATNVSYPWILVALVALAIGCGDRESGPEASTGRLFQVGTLQALLEGDYTGYWSYAEVEPMGDVGLGTFEGINGELVVADGGYWHVYPDGSVREVDPSERTPFAQVTSFVPSMSGTVPGPLDCGSTLDTFLSRQAGYGEDILYVATVTGQFSSITTRAIDKQEPPYEPLADLIPTQHEFPMSNVTGTMVLVHTPSSLGMLSPAGFHYHFVTSDRQRGGHVLSCTVEEARAAYQEMTGIDVEFPPPVYASSPR